MTTVVVENRSTGILTWFVALWLVVWCIITGTMLYALLFDNNGRYGFLFSTLFVLALIGVPMINNFLWNIRGKHVITFGAKHLTVKRAGTINFFASHNVKYSNLSRFSLSKVNTRGLSKSLWGLPAYKVCGKCSYQDFYLASGWKSKDAKLLVLELNNILTRVKSELNNP